jgi:hypothetical protein
LVNRYPVEVVSEEEEDAWLAKRWQWARERMTDEERRRFDELRSRLLE